MKATLTTKCGCTREMQIPYPPQHQIVIPLRENRLWAYFDETVEDVKAPMFKTRVFELYREYPAGPYGHAEYLEK